MEAVTPSALLAGGGGALLSEDRLREDVLRQAEDRFLYPGEGKVVRRFYSTFQHLKGAAREVEKDLTNACSVRTKGNGFGLKEGRFRFRY